MIPTKEAIQEAHKIIRPYIHRTPVLTSKNLNEMLGMDLFFKCENFQRCGAFKMRGATHAINRLSKGELQKGVATHSSGNHAQALALAAQTMGVPAYIVMPRTAPKVKVAGVKHYGAEIIFCEPTLAARESTLEDVVDRTGATFIHPFDNYHVIEGQATAAVEILGSISNLDFLLAPVGGGGLLSGTSLSAHYFAPETKVIGCEPSGADDAFRSMQAGHIIPSEHPNTISDGLLTSLSEKTFEIIQKHVEEIITVDDPEIITAMQLIWERMKIVIEPSAAVPFAVVMTNPDKFKGKRIGIILSGGNVDLGNLPWN